MQAPTLGFTNKVDLVKQNVTVEEGDCWRGAARHLLGLSLHRERREAQRGWNRSPWASAGWRVSRPLTEGSGCQPAYRLGLGSVPSGESGGAAPHRPPAWWPQEPGTQDGLLCRTVGAPRGPLKLRLEQEGPTPSSQPLFRHLHRANSLPAVSARPSLRVALRPGLSSRSQLGQDSGDAAPEMTEPSPRGPLRGDRRREPSQTRKSLPFCSQ